MTHPQTCEANAKQFPDDSLWQRHCAKVTAYLNSVKPVEKVPVEPLHDGMSLDRIRDILSGEDR